MVNRHVVARSLATPTWLILFVGAILSNPSAQAQTSIQFTTLAANIQPWNPLILLNWTPAPATGQFLLLTNPSNNVPGFTGSGQYNTTLGGWQINSGSETYVPYSLDPAAGVGVGTMFTFQLYTCSTSTNVCSGMPSSTSDTIIPNFSTTNITVLPNTLVSLHWQPVSSNAPGGSFFELANSPANLPNFSSTGVTWPSNANASYNSAAALWATHSNSVQLAIPADATPNTTYILQLYSCDLGVGCSNTPGASGPTNAQITLTVAANWTTNGYGTVFSTPQLIDETQQMGRPLDISIDSSDNLWNTSEFSNTLTQTSSSTWAVKPITVMANETACTGQMGCPFTDDSTIPASTVSWSASSERVIIASDGKIWFIQGGWSLLPLTWELNNYSTINAYDPTTGFMCTYYTPMTTNSSGVHGIGITGTGANQTVWFTSDSIVLAGPDSIFTLASPGLGYFQPSSLETSCASGSASYVLRGFTDVQYVSLPGFMRTVSAPSFQQPAHIAVDNFSNALWITSFWGSQIAEMNLGGSGMITYYSLATQNNYSFFGVGPWRIVVDAGYVYAADYYDGTLTRIIKATGAIDSVSIPRTSDTENPHSLTFDKKMKYLYFTLDDDANAGGGLSFPASTFGRIDISAWEAASAACSSGTDCAPAPAVATVYYGLDTYLAAYDVTYGTDLQGIAVGTAGDIAIADYSGYLVRLLKN
jgi:hypothetical protein